jgi:endonuclease/exonuclease/phosphatase family metal-dependent hydrolase
VELCRPRRLPEQLGRATFRRSWTLPQRSCPLREQAFVPDLKERMLQIRHLKERVFAYPMEGGAVSGAAEFGFPEPPCPEAFILMGDFNMIQGSPEYVLMTGETDYAEGRQVVNHHPVDAFTLGQPLPAGSVSWFDGNKPERNRLIDYAFLHASLMHRVTRSWIDQHAHGSDHLPVWLEMD